MHVSTIHQHGLYLHGNKDIELLLKHANICTLISSRLKFCLPGLLPNTIATAKAIA